MHLYIWIFLQNHRFKKIEICNTVLAAVVDEHIGIALLGAFFVKGPIYVFTLFPSTA